MNSKDGFYSGENQTSSFALRQILGNRSLNGFSMPLFSLITSDFSKFNSFFDITLGIDSMIKMQGGEIKPVEVNWDNHTENLQADTLDISAATHVGIKRSNNPNQDRFAIKEKDDMVVACAVDGMGGYEDGDISANLLATNFSTHIFEHCPTYSTDGIITAVAATVDNLDNDLREAKKQGVIEDKRSGATLSGAIINKTTGEGVFAHVGDARGYIINRETGEIRQLGKDHSIVQQFLDKGAITEGERYTHPHRSYIYRAIDNSGEQEPEIVPFNLQPAEVLLLCSDGLWEMIMDTEIAEIVTSCQNARQMTEKLVARANKHGHTETYEGGVDNITAIAILRDEIMGKATLTMRRNSP